jgi:hypothetical protein
MSSRILTISILALVMFLSAISTLFTKQNQVFFNLNEVEVTSPINTTNSALAEPTQQQSNIKTSRYKLIFGSENNSFDPNEIFLEESSLRTNFITSNVSIPKNRLITDRFHLTTSPRAPPFTTV